MEQCGSLTCCTGRIAVVTRCALSAHAPIIGFVFFCRRICWSLFCDVGNVSQVFVSIDFGVNEEFGNILLILVSD